MLNIEFLVHTVFFLSALRKCRCVVVSVVSDKYLVINHTVVPLYMMGSFFLAVSRIFSLSSSFNCLICPVVALFIFILLGTH